MTAIKKTPQPQKELQDNIARNEGGMTENRWDLGSFKVHALVVALLGLVFYMNTFSNSWAFDDSLVIVKNSYVQEGVSGMSKIFTSDAYQSVGENVKADGNQLSGGRYRPLSIATFAMEQQILGLPQGPTQDADAKKAAENKLVSDMHFRHVVNVLLYMLTGVVLLYFLRKIVFQSAPLAALLSAVVFMVHPLHTEVVANVKSRDEILSMLFIALTFTTGFNYFEKKDRKSLGLSLLCFLLALLSKEYAVVVIALMPLALYTFKEIELNKSFKASVIYLVPMGVYILMRFSAVKPMANGVEDEVMNNCYLLATGVEKAATIIYVPINYIKLLFLPHPLAADYNFKQIPYTNFSDVLVWLSLVVHVGLSALMVMSLRKRHVVGFALALYFAFLLPVSNVFLNIGAPMAERLIFHSSLGFAIIVGYLIFRGYEKLSPTPTAKIAVGGLMTLLVVLSGFKTITRNKDWESDDTLFEKDVQTVPNSVLVNNNAAAVYIRRSRNAPDEEKKQLLWQAIPYLDKAIQLNGKFVMAYLNRGVCYFRLGDYDRAHSDCDTVVKYYPELPDLKVLAGPLSTYYCNEGIKYGTNNDDSLAIMYFRKAADVTPFDVRIQCNLAMQYVKDQRFPEAKAVLGRVLQMAPSDEQALQLMQMASAGK